MDSFNSEATILSIDLNQDEDEVIIEEELPGYTWYPFSIFVTNKLSSPKSVTNIDITFL